MENNILEDVLSDEEFVKKLLSLRSGEEVRHALEDKGVALEEKDLGKFCGKLADVLEQTLIEKQMNHVVGGCAKEVLQKVVHWDKKIMDDIRAWVKKH